MPLPIILIGALVVGGVIGVAAGAGGMGNFNEAKKRSENAKRRHESAKNKTERARRHFMRRAGTYGDVQIEVARDTVGGFLRLIEELERQGQSLDIDIFEDIQISPTELRNEYRHIVDLSGALASGGLSGAAAGGSASTSAVGLVGLFASASTGTPISLLSGAAAKSATLAWLGGGPLAVGGGGVAMGSIVLGGIVVAPALLIGGLVLAAKGEKALTQAREYESKVNVACKELDKLCDFLKRAEKRVDELETVLRTLSELAQAAMVRIDPSIIDLSDLKDRERFTGAFILVNGIVDILRAPVLDNAGNLSSNSAKVLTRTRKLI